MFAVIGGTGFGEFVGLTDVSQDNVRTTWGESIVQMGLIDSSPVLFLSRHGEHADTPPHRINYRANVQALKDEGANAIVAVNAVGAVDESLAVPQLVVPDQLIDYTFGRQHTFFDDKAHHIEFTFPYDDDMRSALIASARDVGGETGIALAESGTYGCTQGPRLETAAEIRRLAQDGCHVVGMTGMPEAALARELELPYASLCVVVNAGAGLGGKAIDMAGIAAAVEQGMSAARQVVTRVITNYGD